MKSVPLTNALVYRTAKGYHLYYQVEYPSNTSKIYINLLECLLGSDLRKQTFFLGENRDVLFRRKKRVNEKLDIKATGVLNETIRKLMKEQVKLNHYEISVK
jgi:hypothetical protein